MEAETQASKLRRLKDRRDTLKMSLRTLRSDIGDPSRLNKSIEHDLQTIEIIKSRILANQQRLATMHETHDATVAKLSSVNSQIKLEDNAVKIRALKRVAVAMFNISKSQEPEPEPEAVLS